jgi:amino-acid N-acetyltransferase
MIQLLEDHIAVTHRNDACVIRQAAYADVDGIALLVGQHARQGHLLPRSADNIRASLSTWIVAEASDAIIACGSLLEITPTLVEIRSLAVAPAYRSHGLGAQIVSALVNEARRRAIPTVFALTRVVPFFERQGFSVTTKDRFPEKILNDCQICPLQHCCDETAVVLELAEQQ